MGNGLSCREIFGKCLTWAEPGQKAEIFPLSCAQPTGKVLVQNNSTMDSVHSLGMPFGVPNPPDIKNPNPRKIDCGFKKSNFNLCISSHAGNFAKFNGTIIFQTRAMEYRQKTDVGDINENGFSAYSRTLVVVTAL